VSPEISFQDLISTLKSLFRDVKDSDWNKVSMKYLDDENDICSITSEEELRESFHGKKGTLLKIHIDFPQTTPPERPTKRPHCRPMPMSHIYPWNPLQQQQQQQPQPLPQPPREFRPRGFIYASLHEEGIALMDAKEYEKAKSIFLQQADLVKCPFKKSSPLYNVACCESLLGNIDSALSYLHQAVICGYKDVQHMETDVDLNSLHGLEAFQSLLSTLRSPQEQKPRCNRTVDVNGNNYKPRWRRFQDCAFPGFVLQVQPQADPTVQTEPTEPTALPRETLLQKQPEVIVQVQPSEPTIHSEPVIVPIIQPQTVPNDQPTKQPDQVVEPTVEFVSPFQVALSYLAQMGFTDVNRNLKVLTKTKGDLTAAVEQLLR